VAIIDAATISLQKCVWGLLSRRRCAAAKRNMLMLQAVVRGCLIRKEFKSQQAAITVRRVGTTMSFV
jgi:hypothetical protein